MAFKKGHKGYKPKAPNKKTKEAVERIEWVLSLLEPNLEHDIAMLKEVERVNLWNSLQEYVRPKLARTEVVADIEISGIKSIIVEPASKVKS